MGLTQSRQRAKTITDYRQNDLKITDYRQEKYNRLQTWADIVNICFQKKEHFAFFSRKEVTSLNLWLIRWPKGKNFLFFFYTGTLLQPTSKSQSHTTKMLPTLSILLKRQRWRNRTFLVSVREMLRLILKENSFPFNGKHYQYRPTAPRWAQRQQFPFQYFHGMYWNTKFT